MSYDSSYDEYHLTPKSWVGGVSEYMGQQSEVSPPADRVETWARRMTQPSASSPDAVAWECIWQSPEHSDTARKRLRERLPKPHKDFPMSGG